MYFVMKKPGPIKPIGVIIGNKKKVRINKRKLFANNRSSEK